MRVDDFVCLGRTVPETSAKYGVKVCMAGYSEELRSLLRVYPLEVNNPIHARSRCVLELERNTKDSRIESWKLGDRNGSIIDVGSEVKQSEVVQFLRKHRAESICELNDGRKSLGVLEIPEGCKGVFRKREDVACPLQRTLFDILDSPTAFGAGAIDIAPYIEFFDPAGKPHSLQIREWGTYEFIRKHRHQADSVWRNLQLRDGRPTLLVVGNMSHQRNVWLIIKTFKVDVTLQHSLFDVIPNEEGTAWSPCKSEA